MFRALFMLFSLENCGLGKRTESLTTEFMPFLSFPARVTLRLPPSLRVCVDERTLACSHANGYFLICLTYCFCNDYGLLPQVFSIGHFAPVAAVQFCSTP